MSDKLKGYVCWEADSHCAPTGPERLLEAVSLRRAMRHIADEVGGKLSSCGKLVRMPDGKIWAGRVYRK